jgi:hypothetical protein
MILEEKDAIARFESPLNLLNRLKSSLSRPHSKPTIASIPPSSSEIIEDLDEKLKSGGLKSKAAGIMNDCLNELKSRIPEVDRPSQLSQIAETMNKIISSEDKNKNDNQNQPQFIIYSPTFISEDHFDTVYVKE